MSEVKLVAIFAENKTGQLAAITQALAQAGVNIRWVAIASSEAFGVVKVLVNEPDPACEVLRAKGFMFSLLEVLAIAVEDQPGGLDAVVKTLARNKINLRNASGFVAHGRAVLLIEVESAAKARRILAKKQLHILTQEEVMEF